MFFSLHVEPKPRAPCLSTPSARGKKAGSQLPVNGPSIIQTPVHRTPSSRPVSHTEPRAPPNSRYCMFTIHAISGVIHDIYILLFVFVRVVVCKTPGCFLQSLSVPGSSYCRNFKQNKEELTSKLYQLYNTSVFDSKVHVNTFNSICSDY